MIALFLGKKEVGKTALQRKLTYLRLMASPRATVFFHDPQRQLEPSAGVVFNSIADARSYAALRGGFPRLAIFWRVSAEELCDLAVEVKHVTLVIDEMDRLFDGKKWLTRNAYLIANEGRHFGVDLFGSFRSTRNVSEDVLTLADFVFIFRHSRMGVHDLRNLRQRLGDGYAEAAAELEPMHFVLWQDD